MCDSIKSKYDRNRVAADTLAWKDLPLGVRTAVVSVLFRFGLNGPPKFFANVASNDFKSAVSELRNLFVVCNAVIFVQNLEKLHSQKPHTP